MNIKQTLACNQSVVLGLASMNQTGGKDLTPPSLWYIMRDPYNPGGYGMGSLYNYKYTLMPNVFHIYTFAYDVSGIKDVTVHIRVDEDGVNPVHDHVKWIKKLLLVSLNNCHWQLFNETNNNFFIQHAQANELYNPEQFGWSGVGEWNNYTMVRRQFPKGNEQGAQFQFFPILIADEYYYHGNCHTYFTHYQYSFWACECSARYILITCLTLRRLLC